MLLNINRAFCQFQILCLNSLKFLKKIYQGLESSVVRNVSFYCKTTRFDSQDPHGSLQLPVTPGLGDPIPFSDLCMLLQACDAYTYIQHHTHIHKNVKIENNILGTKYLLNE